MEPTYTDPQGHSIRHPNARIPHALLESIPDAAAIHGHVRGRNLVFLIAAFLCAILIGASFVAMELDSITFPLLIIGVVTTLVLLWRYPLMPIYVALVASCLFEIFPRNFPDEITGKTFFWLNLNSLLQTNGVSAEGLPVSPFELILVVSGFFSLLQAVFGNRVAIQKGTLWPPMLLYTSFVIMNYLRGWADGSDYTKMLQEVRAQIYLPIAYLMALNIPKDKRVISRFFWISALCIGLKGILYTYRRYITLSGQDIGDQGVGSHEEAFFFNCFIALILSLWMVRSERRLQSWMLLLLPLVYLGFVATNRRAGTAGIVLAMPILVMIAYKVFPHRRKLAAIAGAAMLTLGPAYYYTFRNSPSSIAQPARAIKSHFEPDARDEASNGYRNAENANILFTIKQDPITALTGYGYGKPFLKIVPMVNIGDIYENWDILPHNQILWIWMRTGAIGMAAFWGIMGCALFSACRILRRRTHVDPDMQALALWAVGTTILLVVAGLYDLQISNYRNMVFFGLIIGLMEGVRLRTAPRQEVADETPEFVNPSMLPLALPEPRR